MEPSMMFWTIDGKSRKSEVNRKSMSVHGKSGKRGGENDY